VLKRSIGGAPRFYQSSTNFVGDEEEIELELDLHERGWRVCQASSRREPNGEFGHITESRLLAISQEDFEDTLRLLRGCELAAHDEHICNAAARAHKRSWSLSGPLG
jgi:hypothetical protein